ncbi:hypothetical protein [Ruficoccus sp. ZRK36]|uniref:tetratricopeptide repeat protein n=1 Tax=Ruficoccus sp. ZRK36 TaxID=2866311 RepID=UPI001C72F628|nr:hypothetical protein [Ruficoccus sp. ZRK36]QYY37119.1 hypothetical protein K0V07_06455 [Ruficoccus sp. ZRK36]
MRIKLIIIAVVTAIFIGVLWWLLAMWGQTQLETELEEAQKAYEAGYNDRMIEQLEMAVARDPDSISTLQVQARLLDGIENAGCLPVYERLSGLQPDDITAFRDWMGALVRYGRLDEARSIYEKFEAAGPPLGGTASFSRLGADLAGTAQDENARLAYLREAYERAPDDAEVGVELSRAETQVLPAADLSATVRRLDSLLGRDQVRVEAAALLLQIETALGDKQRLQSAAQRVWDAGAGDVSMRLLALEAFYDLNREDFEQRLKELIIEEQRNVPALTSIFNWLLARGENELIIELAMEDKAVMNINRPPVANRVAEAMVQTDQLKALRAYNSRVDWTGAEGFASLLPPLTLTLDREEARDVPNPAFTRWLSSAALPQLREVLPVTARLGFEREEVAILQEIIRDDPWDRSAYDQLYALFKGRSDTLAMLRLLQEERENFPQDRDLSSEYAWIAMVLDVDRRGAERIAQLNYSYDPENPAYQICWAFALCKSREPAKALEVLGRVDPLGVRGQLVKAYACRLLDDKEGYEQALQGVDMDALLPEERKFVQSARPLPKDD